MGHLPEAKKFLAKCQEKAEILNDKLYTGIVLHNYAYMYYLEGDYIAAIESLDEAFEYFEKEPGYYLANLYRKARCYVAMDCPNYCTPLLDEGKKLSKENEHYTVLFKGLEYLLSLNKPDSASKLETTTIPYLIKNNGYIDALDFCEVLIEFHEKKGPGHQKKALTVSNHARKIYRDMYKGGEI